MSTYTFTNIHNVTHKWVIKNFKENLNFHESIEKNFSMYSSKFSLNKTDKKQFQLKLKFNETDSDFVDWLTLYLCWCNLDQPVKIKFELYLLNNENVKCNIFTSAQTSDRDEIWGWDEFCEKKELLDKAEELLPSNTLIIGCDVFVYDENVNIPFVYEQNSKLLMEDQYRKLLESEKGSDFIFEVDGYEIKVHKSILMARSPVFDAMFQYEMIESKTSRSKIMDIRPKIFQIMIEFIYTDQVEKNSLTKDNAMELLAAAEKYQLENLKHICGEFLHKLIDFENVMEILSLAEQHNVEPLISSIENFIKANKQEVLDTIDSEYFVTNGHHARR